MAAPTTGNFGNPYKSISARRGLKANIPILRDGELGFCTDTHELAVGSAAGVNYFFKGVANEGPVLSGDLSSPEVVIPAEGLASITDVPDQVHAITGRPGQGGEIVTAAKQVPSASTFGRIVRLIGSSDTDFPIFKDGTGLRLNGEWRGTKNAMIALMSLGAGQDYIEISRS